MCSVSSSKYFVAYASIVMSIASLFALMFFLLPQRSINQSSYDKIRVDMTKEDVAKIIGAEPRNYSIRRRDFKHLDFMLCDPEAHDPEPVDFDELYEWVTNDFAIEIGLTNDRVVTKACKRLPPPRLVEYWDFALEMFRRE